MAGNGIVLSNFGALNESAEKGQDKDVSTTLPHYFCEEFYFWFYLCSDSLS